MSIKIEDCIFASPEQMEFVIMGMRNPMNSWEKSDSRYGCDFGLCSDPCVFSPEWCDNTQRYVLGDNDLNLMKTLSRSGSEHRKYLRMLPVWVNITAPLYWWKEFDTYKVGTVANSCSTMHKIMEKRFEREDFSCEHLKNCDQGHWMVALDNVISALNVAREQYLTALKTEEYTGLPAKDIWYNVIQLLPSSYNQKRSIFMNAEVLLNIYNQRFGHKLDEWRELCFFIEDCPYWPFIEPGVFEKRKGER